MSQRSLRLGVVGVGRHGSRYARHATEVNGLELAAVSRRDRAKGEALARELGCEFTDDARALCTRDDIDAIAFVTVPALLTELVPLAARSGKRLLIEKPVAIDLATGRRLAEAVERAGVYCMAGHTLRFNAVANAIRERVGRLGRIDSLVFSQRFGPQLELGWLDDPAQSGGGSVLHTGVHCFDLIRFITGLEPAEVSCHSFAVHTKRTEDNFAATLRMSNGSALALVTCSRSSPIRNGLIEIAGEAGYLHGDHVLNTLFEITSGRREDVDLGPSKLTVREALERFAADARANAPSPIPYIDGLHAVAIADACYRSMQSRRSERVATV